MSMEPPSGSQPSEAASTPPDPAPSAPTPDPAPSAAPTPDPAPTTPDPAPTQTWAPAQPPAPPATAAPPPVAWESPESVAGPAPGIEFAPHGARLVAYLLDGFIIGIVAGIVASVGAAVIFGGTTFEGDRVVDVSTSAAAIGSVLILIAVLFALLYFPYFWANGGQTIGMRPFDLRVVRDRDGGRIGWGTAWLRLVGLWIAGAVFYIGYIWIFIDKRRRGWQDLIAGTCVIKQG
jgi:uncharacterized RDD family membrane protein YckC